MKKYVPWEKLSKKRKKERNKAFRRGWGCINPATRYPPKPKVYDRNKEKAALKDETEPERG
jgi:hypothetical protein